MTQLYHEPTSPAVCEATGQKTAFEWDDDLPGARARARAVSRSRVPRVARSQIRDAAGGGQFYCVETGKHFLDQHALDSHKKSREFKRRRVTRSCARARGGRQKGARARR